MSTYFPASKDGTPHQKAQYWLEKAVSFETSGQQVQSDMALKMALKCEGEAAPMAMAA